MKHKRAIALALVLALALSALTASALAASPVTDGSTGATAQAEGRPQGRSGQKVAEPENAVGKDAARETALADAGVTAEQAGKVRARLSRLDDGTVVYKVRFTCDGQRYSYQIDALTGTVADKHAEAVTEEETTRSRKHGGHGRGQNGKCAAKDDGSAPGSPTGAESA